MIRGLSKSTAPQTRGRVGAELALGKLCFGRHCCSHQTKRPAYLVKIREKALHSISSNRDSLIGTPLVSLEKYRDNSAFGGKNRGQAINKD